MADSQGGNDPADTHNVSLGTSAKGAVGGFLLGLALQVLGATAGTTVPSAELSALPFAFAMGGAAVAYGLS